MMQISEVTTPTECPGRIWITGKAAVAPDPGAALAAVGANTVVCLVEQHELTDRHAEYLRWLHGHRSTDAVWFPIRDLHAPSVPKAELLLGELVTRLRAGEGLLVHCGAGIGRSGTIVACLLVEFGMSAADSLEAVAAVGAGPEVAAQRDLVEELAARRGR